jgi:predicted SAM-dependent methyltransferase
MAQALPKRLHFGAGSEIIPGFLNSDMLGNLPINICRKLPFGDDQIDLIYTSHLVEHVHKEDFKFFLRETRRILKPRGAHIIATPTIEKAATNVYGNGIDVLSTLMEPHRPFMQEDFLCPAHYLNHLMRWYDHKWLYDKCLISGLALEADYSQVESVSNFDVPDADLRGHLIQTKDVVWDLETETFILTK